MRAGSLRHLVTIQSYTEISNTFGEASKAWAEFSEAYANITPLKGTEKYLSKEKHATATHQVTIRYLDGVDTKMRIIYGSRTFEIVSVANVGERDRMMQLIVEEEAEND